ncbi:hypothetical protein HAX54_011885, partial [Datura stramonium]|nr:hypothetical protein [Datura stramonium]
EGQELHNFRLPCVPLGVPQSPSAKRSAYAWEKYCKLSTTHMRLLTCRQAPPVKCRCLVMTSNRNNTDKNTRGLLPPKAKTKAKAKARTLPSVLIQKKVCTYVSRGMDSYFIKYRMTWPFTQRRALTWHGSRMSSQYVCACHKGLIAFLDAPVMLLS